MRHFLPSLLSLLLAATLPACSRPETPANGATAGNAGETTQARTASPAEAGAARTFAFRVGTLEAVALHDGTIDAPNDGKTFGLGQPTERVAALLAAAGEPGDTLHLDIQPLLVRGQGRTLLFDTGAGDASFARAGRLPDALRAAGVTPDQVTDVFLSHRHPDHTGGLLTREGALAFPNATIHLSEGEWAALQADTDATALVAAIRAKVAAFQAGAPILPGLVTAVALDGHTPGHAGYEIGAGDDRLLYLGDVVHHFVVSVQRPDWTVQYDEDAELAQRRRRELLQRAADQALRVYAVHFPFPGLGRIVVRDGHPAWSAEG